MDDHLREALATLGQRIEFAEYERRLAVDAVRELTYPRLLRGRLIDDTLIRDRAAQIVQVAIGVGR